MKKFGYKNAPFDDQIFKEVCKDIGLDHTKFDNEKKEDANKYACKVFKNRYLFDKGTYDIKKLIVLGFLYCKHTSLEDKLDEFWALVNPEVAYSVTREQVKDILRIMFYFTV